jgi:hypothetical protein
MEGKNLKTGDPSEDLGTNERILNWVLQKQDGRM